MIHLPPMFTNILLVWFHFIGDFIAQTDRMAIGKSKSNLHLGHHCAVYAVHIAFVCSIVMPLGVLVPMVLMNTGSHFIIDYLTSRANARLWVAGERHWFFTMIGFDQALHVTILLYTASLFY